ncbi:MAG: four helix bundle protein, partial [Deltaproteobacteria bacterium]|nr:four helix bundle protein [Deltaproteobacteria bacterium]
MEHRIWLISKRVGDFLRIRGVKDSRVRVKCLKIKGLEIYKVFARFPKEERLGLMSHVRGASASVPSNMREQALESLSKIP